MRSNKKVPIQHISWFLQPRHTYSMYIHVYMYIMYVHTHTQLTVEATRFSSTLATMSSRAFVSSASFFFRACSCTPSLLFLPGVVVGVTAGRGGGGGGGGGGRNYMYSIWPQCTHVWGEGGEKGRETRWEVNRAMYMFLNER